eukprot:6189454-Pleurochrysis_carterae.AAC.2
MDLRLLPPSSALTPAPLDLGVAAASAIGNAVAPPLRVSPLIARALISHYKKRRIWRTSPLHT